MVRVRGCLAVPPARAALETGSLGSVEVALVALDSTLHSQLASPADIADAYAPMEHWPRTRHLQVAVRMADACAASVGETRTRWLFFDQGLPAPDLQHHVYAASGRLVGITDFAWRKRRLLGEFDGRVKYGRLVPAGQAPRDVVFAEKVREDDLRRTTRCGMSRVIWTDLDRPRLTANRVRAELSDP